MSLKKWIEKLKNKTQQSLNDDKSPEIQRDRMIKNTKTAMDAGKKLIDTVKKGQDLSTKAREKLIDIADKASPIADTVDKKTNEIADKTKKSLSSATESVSKSFSQAQKSYLERKAKVEAEEAKQPTTGSRITDWISPAVPDTEATKSKEKRQKNQPKGPKK